MKNNKFIIFGFLGFAVVLLGIQLSSHPLIESRMYTCGECRLHRDSRRIFSVVISNSTIETKCSSWYKSQYGNDHKHVWILAPLIQYKNINGDGKASITLSKGESLWALSSDEQLQYLKNSIGQDRSIRLEIIKKLYKATLQDDKEAATSTLIEIKQTLK
ncbi:hypothetical protein [Gimesia maris]|uniref:Uncharacterized protein n=1 Tax=Gimesia maris TaxID=122 RepID=A0A3D3R7I4_9PLAN|nr:hypothetical protein [Gimesia maris]EDL59195.1 hypothetical protein PM8797T_23149 [Gimesia maris DSM 8797]QEG18259.1 hypothetical protein GmarT_41450 [Gimesia maris]QGQ28748.1 hypothetical protein F1729_08885 [Gimesia maris]HCO24854.1 hypothetical protein [Gimesia maris]|tara:strand:- start:824 stop:1303 length:480 start_codon:yes stop_codon:yes gene_type:complete